MNPFHDLERRIDRMMRELFGGGKAAGPSQGREIVEIQRMILDRVMDRVQLLPRARRVFPFNEVAVRIPAPEPERRAGFEMVFAADGALEQDIREHLRRERVEFPADLKVRVTLVETGEVTEPSVVCTRREAAAPETAPAAGLRAVRFTPMNGAAPVEVRKQRIHIGRYAEVLDDRRRLVRRNDVVLDDGTVSRAHAHLEFEDGAFRLFDDGSSYGTSVIHQGRLVEVPKAGARGFRLDSGDEIYFGQARVRFEVIE